MQRGNQSLQMGALQLMSDTSRDAKHMNSTHNTVNPFQTNVVLMGNSFINSPTSNGQLNTNPSGQLYPYTAGSGDGQSEESAQPILSLELKKLRLRISDYNKNPILDSICLKIWNLLLIIQYEEILMELVHHPASLPLDLDIYEKLM